LWWRRVEQVLEFEAAQVGVDVGGHPRADRLAIRGHEFVEDDERVGDVGRRRRTGMCAAVTSAWLSPPSSVTNR